MTTGSFNAQPLVCLEGVSKRFSGHAAVDHVSLDIERGEFFALLGPSGCGKTTLLRLLAGFERADEGRILLDGEDIGAVPPYRRPVNMMFQSYALFPHLTVERNVAFGLRHDNLDRVDVETRVREMLALVKIEALATRKPHQLSGGQRQRVALARALVKRPKVFLLDEPMAALDKKLRAETQFELKELQKRLGLTFLIVTHDQEEAMSMADRIGVMNHGQLVQVAAPAEIYEQPNSRWVAEFVGDVNLFEGRVAEMSGGTAAIDSAAIGRFRAARAGEVKPGDNVVVALRPEKLRIAREPHASPQENTARGTVADIGYRGGMTVYKISLESGTPAKAAVANLTRYVDNTIGRGTPVSLSFAPDACVVLTR